MLAEADALAFAPPFALADTGEVNEPGWVGCVVDASGLVIDVVSEPFALPEPFALAFTRRDGFWLGVVVAVAAGASVDVGAASFAESSVPVRLPAALPLPFAW